MAFKSLATSGIVNSAKYQNALVGNAAFSPSTYDLISTAYGTGSSGTISFSSIPSNYKHLQIRWTARTTASASYALTFTINGVGGSSYAWHQLRGWNSSVSSQAQTSQGNINAGSITGTDSSTGVFSSGIIDFVDAFSTTNNKTSRLLSGNPQTNGNGEQILFQSGLLMDTSAISSISLAVGSGSFTTGSRFSLYGIKEA